MNCEDHVVYPFKGEEDCCSDRYSCMVSLECACGFKGCGSCMERHIMDLHMMKQLTLGESS